MPAQVHAGAIFFLVLRVPYSRERTDGRAVMAEYGQEMACMHYSLNESRFWLPFSLKPLFLLFADSEEAEKPVNGSGVHFSTHFPRSREERRMIDITRDKPIKVTVRVVVPVRDHPKVSGKVTQRRTSSTGRLKWRPTQALSPRPESDTRDSHPCNCSINQSLSFVPTCNSTVQFETINLDHLVNFGMMLNYFFCAKEQYQNFTSF